MADLDVHYDPITVTNNPSTVEIQGLDNIKDTIILETPQPLKSDTKSEFIFSQPIKTESKTELAFPQPIQTISSAELDIKPLLFDQCLSIRFDPLPPTCIRQPYQQHFGVTLFGVELIGFNLEGETQMIITDLPKQPQIAWGGEQARIQNSPERVQPAEESPLRIRLGK